MLLACLAINVIHDALDLGPDFLEPGFGGLVDLVLLGGAILPAGLSDREYFLGGDPKVQSNTEAIGR